MTVHRKQLAGVSNVHPTAFLAGLMDLCAGLTRTELDGIAAVLGPRWCMMLHHDLGGEAMAIVMEASVMDVPGMDVPGMGVPVADVPAQPAAPSPAHAAAQHTRRPDHLFAPSWVVHREGALLRLDVCDGDTYTRLGAYPALAPLLASLRTVTEASGRH